MFKFPLKNPSPDFESFRQVLKGEKKPDKVYFVELGVDIEVMRFITENLMGEKWVSLDYDDFFKNANFSKMDDKASWKQYIKQYINFYSKMGYDYIPDGIGLRYFLSFLPRPRVASDTASLSKGERVWAEEGRGLISSWEDFERFPWRTFEKMRIDLEEYHGFLNKNLPEGMKIVVMHSLYEQVMERILGYEGLFYLIYDEPDLVKAVVDRWGGIVYSFYKNVISLEGIEAIFHADDLGYKTGTMLNPDILRKLIFPWFKKYASLAHKYGKLYLYHCCGNVLEVMEDLIEDVGIDGFHSFQDVIIPVTEFKRKYGDRIATLGGVDMDKLSRLDEENLRKYVRGILDECMPGRYALGSGNTIANYVPVENYLIMLDEGLRWKG